MRGLGQAGDFATAFLGMWANGGGRTNNKKFLGGEKKHRGGYTSKEDNISFGEGGGNIFPGEIYKSRVGLLTDQRACYNHKHIFCGAGGRKDNSTRYNVRKGVKARSR